MKALVLSGGGANGAYQAGALGYLDEQDITFGYIVGTSAGALNAVGYALYGSDWLMDLWANLRNRDVMKGLGKPSLVWNIVRGRSGLIDTSPLKALLTEKITDPIPEGGDTPEVVVGVVTRDGRYRAISVNGLPPHILVDLLMASSAIPVIFPPGQSSWVGEAVDGGVRNVVPTRDAIRVAPDEIYVVKCQPQHYTPPMLRPDGVLENANWAIATLMDEIARNDVDHFLEVNHLLRYAEPNVPHMKTVGRFYKNYDVCVIEPQTSLGSPLDFERPAASDRMARGYSDARHAVRNKRGD